MNYSIGLLATAFAVFFLATPVPVSAGDTADAEEAAAEQEYSTEQEQRKLALEAEKASANNAAERLLKNTRLDLDIRLIGHSSKSVAATR